MSSVPGVVITGTPGASQGSGGVPSSLNTPASPVPSSSAGPPPPSSPAPVKDYYGNIVTDPSKPYVVGVQEIPSQAKGTSGRTILEYSTGLESSSPIAYANNVNTYAGPNASILGTSTTTKQTTLPDPSILGINYISQTGNLTGTITSGGPSTRDLYVKDVLTEAASGFKGNEPSTGAFISNALGQIGLAYDPQTKTITDQLQEDILATQATNTLEGGHPGGYAGGAGPETPQSLALGSSEGQAGLGYVTDTYSPAQIKSLTQPITEYGNIPNFFSGSINTSAIPDPSLALVQVPGGPITPLAKALGSSEGQAALEQLIRNSPGEATSLITEQDKALGINPSSPIYGGIASLQTPSSINGASYNVTLKESLGITDRLSSESSFQTINFLDPNAKPIDLNSLVNSQNESDIKNSVDDLINQGSKSISIFDLKTGSNLGSIAANESAVNIINELSKIEPIYIKNSPDASAISQQLLEYNQNKNDIISKVISPAQQLGLQVNLFDSSGNLISKVPSESSYYSLIQAEQGGKPVSLSIAAPVGTNEIGSYLAKQEQLIGNNTKNNSPLDLLTGIGSGVYNLIVGGEEVLLSLPENTHSILEQGNSEFYGNNNILTTLQNLIKPSPLVEENISKYNPESVLGDIIGLQVPKGSTNYLIGEGLVEGAFFLEQAKDALSYASSLITKSGPVISGLVAKTVLDTTIEGNPFTVYAYKGFGNDNLEGLGISTSTSPKVNGADSLVNPSSLRSFATFKNLNPMRPSIPIDVFSSDNLQTPTGSASPQIPINNLLENLNINLQKQLKSNQEDLLKPVENNNSNTFKSNNSIDIFYKPSKNIGSISGITPPEDLTSSSSPISNQKIPDLSTNNSSSNSLISSSDSSLGNIPGAGVPGSGVAGTIGGVAGNGVPDILSNSNYSDFIDSLQIPREKIIENTKVKKDNEVFNYKGEKLDTLFGSVSSKDPLGLKKITLSSKSNLVELDPLFRNNGKGLGILNGETPIEDLAKGLSPINTKTSNEFNPSRYEKIKSTMRLFDIKGEGALIKSEKIKSNLLELDKSYNPNNASIYKRPNKVDTERLLDIETPEIGQPKGFSKELKKNPNIVSFEKFNVKPDLSDFRNIGVKKPLNKFTEININLGSGPGKLLSKGNKGFFEIFKPTNPKAPSPSEDIAPSSGKTITSGSQMLIQRTKTEQVKQEQKTEELLKPLSKKKKKELEKIGENVSLGIGVSTIIKTSTALKSRPQLKQSSKPKYAQIIRIKQSSKQSSRLDQLIGQKLNQPQKYKESTAQKFKFDQSLAQSKSSLLKQQTDLTTDSLFVPRLETLQSEELKTSQTLIPQTKHEVPPIPPGFEWPDRRKYPKNKKKKAEKANFIGNTSENQIEGIYNRSEINYGLKKVNKLVSKDTSFGIKKNKTKINTSFLNKKYKI